MAGVRASRLAALALYVALAFLLLTPLSLRVSTTLPDDGDAVLGVWIAWWSSTHLALGYPGILEANTFHPHPSALLFSEPMLGQALVAWPLFGVLSNPVLAVNLLTLLTLAVGALAAQVLFEDLTGSRLGAVVGALFFAFNDYTFFNLPRLQLVTLHWMPLGLLCLHRFFLTRRGAYLLAFSLASSLVALSCLYYLLFYLVALGFILPAYVWQFRHSQTAASLFRLGLSGLVVGGVVAALAWPYHELYARYRFESFPKLYDLAGYFAPAHLYQNLGLPAARSAQPLGYLSLAIAAVGVRSLARTRGRTVALALAYLLVGVLAFLLSAGPEITWAGRVLGPGPFSLLDGLPPFRTMNMPGRFAVLVFLVLALLVAWGSAHLLERLRRMGSRPALTAAVLGVLVVAEHWSPGRVQAVEVPTRDRVPDVYPWLGDRSGQAVAELPVRPFQEMRFVTLDAYFSTIHGGKVLFSKPSFYPPAMEFLRHELERFPSRTALILLQALDVRAVVVHPKRWGEGRERQRPLEMIERRLPELKLLRSFPDRDDPLWERLGLGGERVYAVSPLAEELPALPCACPEIPRGSYAVDGSGSTSPLLAVDGRYETKWTTGRTQRKGQFLEVRFDRPRRVARVELEMAFPWGEFPRDLALTGSLGDREWRIEPIEDPWYKVALVRQLVADPTAARFRLDLASEPLDRLRMTINHQRIAVGPWSAAELHVYERSGPPGE